MNMTRKIGFKEFLEIHNPFPVFMKYIQIVLEDKEKYFSLVKPPESIEEYFQDL